MAHEHNETKIDQKTGFSWRERLKKARKPAVAAVAAVAISAASGAAALFGGNEKVHGTPFPEGGATVAEGVETPGQTSDKPVPSSTEAPVSTPPSSESTSTLPTPETKAPALIEAEPSFEAAAAYGLDFARQAVAFIPETAHVETIPHASGDPMLMDYEVRYSPEGTDTLPEDDNTRSYVQARIISQTHQVVVNAALETSGNEVMKRVSFTAEMAPDHPFFMGEGAVWGGTFANEVFAHPDKLSFMELTLTDKSDEPSTVAVGLGETGTPAFLMDTIGTPLSPDSPDAPLFAERLSNGSYINELQTDIFAQLD